MKILARMRGFLVTSHDFLDGLIWAVTNLGSQVGVLKIPPEVWKELAAIARSYNTSVTQVLREMLRQFLQLYQREFERAQIYIHDAQGKQTLALFNTHRKLTDTTALDINIAVFFGRVFVPDRLRQTLKNVALSVGIGENTLWQTALRTGLLIWKTQDSGQAGIFYQKGDEAPMVVRLFSK